MDFVFMSPSLTHFTLVFCLHKLSSFLYTWRILLCKASFLWTASEFNSSKFCFESIFTSSSLVLRTCSLKPPKTHLFHPLRTFLTFNNFRWMAHPLHPSSLASFHVCFTTNFRPGCWNHASNNLKGILSQLLLSSLRTTAAWSDNSFSTPHCFIYGHFARTFGVTRNLSQKPFTGDTEPCDFFQSLFGVQGGAPCWIGWLPFTQLSK